MTTSLEATRAEHPDDAGAVGAERHADANLARPPGDAVADHAVEADRGQCQRQHPNADRRRRRAAGVAASAPGGDPSSSSRGPIDRDPARARRSGARVRRGARLHAAPAGSLPGAPRRRGGRRHQQPAPEPAQHELERVQRRRVRAADRPRRLHRIPGGGRAGVLRGGRHRDPPRAQFQRRRPPGHPARGHHRRGHGPALLDRRRRRRPAVRRREDDPPWLVVGMASDAIYDRFIINTSDDVYVFGLDAETGELAWETQIFDYTEISALHSSGPTIRSGRHRYLGDVGDLHRPGPGVAPQPREQPLRVCVALTRIRPALARDNG